MNDWLERYLDLTALAAVGAALLDPRPAFVASGDGSAILWANAAGLGLFRVSRGSALANAELAPNSPLRTQLSRLSRLLPADRSRLEALALPFRQMTAACRRLNLADGTRAVLVVGEAAAARMPLRVRAQEWVEAFAPDEGSALIADRGGRVLGAVEAIDPGTAVLLRRLVGDADLARATARTVRDDAGTVAHIVSIEDGGEILFLALVRAEAAQSPSENREEAPPTPAQRREEAPAVGEVATVAAPLHPIAPPQPEPLAPPAPPPAVTVAPAPAVTEPAVPSPPVAAAPLPPAIAAPAETPTAPSTPARTADDPSNIVRLHEFGEDAEPLTGSEADAFRKIREALAAGPAAAAAAAAARVHDEASAGSREQAPPPPPPLFDEALLDRLPVGVAIFRDRRTLLVNRTLLDLLGYEDAAAFTASGGVDAVFAEGGRTWSAVGPDERTNGLAARRSDGTALPVDARLNTVTFAGETAFMLAITERQNPPAAQPLADPAGAERRIHDLETILNTATDGVVVVDRHGTIESMNRAAEALFAVEGKDVKGRSVADLLAEESRRSALDYLDGLASNGVASVLNDGREVIGKVPNGGLIPLFMTMGRIGDSGRFCAVLRDITHWKTVEEELTAARREAEAANTQKSEFLAKISHEIRTPLNAIIGFSEIMMEQRFGPIANERYRAYLSDIHVSGAHLMSLINDLLDLSKIEAGKVDLTFESVATNAIIQECVALMQPLANRERIIIRTSLSTELPNVVADARSLRQILLNLMSNAIKFTRAGGQVIVSTLLEPSGEVVVRIRDTGIGMSQKDIETAMKPFEQVSAVQGDRDKGTGLGLPLTKAMVEANRATFAIESAVNQGTLVRITFPTTRVLAG